MLVLSIKTPLEPLSPIDFKRKFWGITMPPKDLSDKIEQIRSRSKKEKTEIACAAEYEVQGRIIYINRKGLPPKCAKFIDGLPLINPTITKSEGLVHSTEFVVKDNKSHPVVVRRPYKIKVEYLNPKGHKCSIDLDGEIASLFCQKLELLDGITPLDLKDDNLKSTSENNGYNVVSQSGYNLIRVILELNKAPQNTLSEKIESIPGVNQYLQITSSSSSLVYLFIRSSVIPTTESEVNEKGAGTVEKKSANVLEKTELMRQIRNLINESGLEITKTTYQVVGKGGATHAETPRTPIASIRRGSREKLPQRHGTHGRHRARA